MIAITGSPVEAFSDAIVTRLRADTAAAANGSTALMSLVTGVYGHVPQGQRTAYDYVTLGGRSRTGGGGGMQNPGGTVSIQIDVWSDGKGPQRAARIQSRIVQLLQHHPLRVSGYEVVEGSLGCEFEDVDDEPDEDSPDRRIYHGVQRWTAEIHQW